MTTTEREIILNRNEAIRWARGVLDRKDGYVIFDTETTGLDDSDVIVHLAVMDLDRVMLINTRVKPLSKRRISADATYMHGFKLSDLKDAPFFEEVYEMLRPIADTKMFLSYNAPFHGGMVKQTYLNEGLTSDEIGLNCIDVKAQYVKFSGHRNPALPGRDNTGVGDCRATLAVLHKMAEAELADEPPPAEPTKEDTYGYWKDIIFFVILVAIVLWLLSR